MMNVCQQLARVWIGGISLVLSLVNNGKAPHVEALIKQSNARHWAKSTFWLIDLGYLPRILQGLGLQISRFLQRLPSYNSCRKFL